MGTFAVGFIARPVNGLVFGHHGDKIGRRTLLVISLLMMGGATFAIGLLPGYATIGFAAPAILVLLRVIQGFTLGGEWGGAALIVSQHDHRVASYSETRDRDLADDPALPTTATR